MCTCIHLSLLTTFFFCQMLLIIHLWRSISNVPLITWMSSDSLVSSLLFKISCIGLYKPRYRYICRWLMSTYIRYVVGFTKIRSPPPPHTHTLYSYSFCLIFRVTIFLKMGSTITRLNVTREEWLPILTTPCFPQTELHHSSGSKSELEHQE